MTNYVSARCTVRGAAHDVAAFRALMVLDPPPRPNAAGLLRRLHALAGPRSTPVQQEEPPESVLDLGRILPMPATLSDDAARAAWALEHWGTQRNAVGYQEFPAPPDDGAGDAGDSGNASLRFGFATAWSFPEPVFEALHRRFPALRFEVVAFEEGHQFALEGAWGPGESGAVEVEPTAALFERVFGHPPDPDEEG